MTIINPNNRYFSNYQNNQSFVEKKIDRPVDATVISALDNNSLFGIFEKVDSRLGSVLTPFGKINLPIDSFDIGQQLLVLKTNQDIITIITIPDMDLSEIELTEIIEKQDYGRFGDFIQLNFTEEASSNEIHDFESHLILNVSEILNNTLSIIEINNLVSLNAKNFFSSLLAIAANIYCSNISGATEDEEILFNHLRSISSATAGLHWQVFLIPYINNDKIDFIQGFKRRKSKNPVFDFENFIFEGSCPKLGKFSLNLLYSRELSIFELILKHELDEGQIIIEDIKKTFLENAYYFNMQAKFSVKKQIHHSENGMLGEVLREYCKNKAFTVLA